MGCYCNTHGGYLGFVVILVMLTLFRSIEMASTGGCKVFLIAGVFNIVGLYHIGMEIQF